MASVFRIKRRLDVEPSEALFISCKRRKTDDTEAPDLSAVLKFAGTVKEDENVVPHIEDRLKDAQANFKKHPVDLTEKLRTLKQEESKTARYKVVSCFRSLDKKSQDLTIFNVETDGCDDDLVTSITTNNSDKKEDYVYDLYYTNSDDFGELEEVSMCPLDDPLIFGSTRDNGFKGLDSDDDSEDSNAENNWRNDYPDESDLDSVNEEDMVQAMQQCDLESSSGEEGFIYSIDSEGAGFEEDIDQTDVQRYGERYARFRARHQDKVVTSDLDREFYYGDIDEEEYY